MKLAILAAIFGSAAVASAHDLRGAPAEAAVEPIVKYVYAPPAVETDLKTLWDELANEATFMQEQIHLGRTTAQCKRECNERAQKNSNFNKGRCRQNCDQIRDKGNNNSGNRNSCDDCRRSFERGTRRYDRCMEACGSARIDDRENCNDAETCGECRRWCSGNSLDRCLDRENCGSSDNDRDGRCSRARTCSECRNWCDDRDDRDDCLDDYCGSGNRDNDCRSGNYSCSKCRNKCSGSDRTKCLDRCDAGNDLLFGAFQQ